MNHSHGFNVTRGCVKLDFTPAWELNAKVIDFIFFSDKKSKQGMAKGFYDTGDSMFRITKKMMIYARAYFTGKVLGEVSDIGFQDRGQRDKEAGSDASGQHIRRMQRPVPRQELRQPERNRL